MLEILAPTQTLSLIVITDCLIKLQYCKAHEGLLAGQRFDQLLISTAYDY